MGWNWELLSTAYIDKAMLLSWVEEINGDRRTVVPEETPMAFRSVQNQRKVELYFTRKIFWPQEQEDASEHRNQTSIIRPTQSSWQYIIYGQLKAFKDNLNDCN